MVQIRAVFVHTTRAWWYLIVSSLVLHEVLAATSGMLVAKRARIRIIAIHDFEPVSSHFLKMKAQGYLLLVFPLSCNASLNIASVYWGGHGTSPRRRHAFLLVAKQHSTSTLRLLVFFPKPGKGSVTLSTILYTSLPLRHCCVQFHCVHHSQTRQSSWYEDRTALLPARDFSAVVLRLGLWYDCVHRLELLSSSTNQCARVWDSSVRYA